MAFRLGRPVSRRRSALASVLTALALGAGCSGLRPLPRPTVSSCGEGTQTTAALWSTLRGLPVPVASESAFASTTRVVIGDMGRKARDQRPGEACGGEPPPGFTLLDGRETEPGVPPLHALYREPEAGRPIVILVHGLYDSKFSGYIRVTALGLARAGLGVLAPDMRWHGCLLSPRWLPSLGIAEAHDLQAWARYLKKIAPGHRVALLGFSMGGLDALHVAGAPPSEQEFDGGIVAVCPPVALDRTLSALDAPSPLADRGPSGLIHSRFRSLLRERLAALDVPVSPRTSFKAFLDWLSRQIGSPGPDPARSFLEAATPVVALQATRTPLLVLATANDPVIPDSSNYALARASESNPWILVIETPYGGHIGQLGLYPAWFSAVVETFFLCVHGP